MVLKQINKDRMCPNCKKCTLVSKQEVLDNIAYTNSSGVLNTEILYDFICGECKCEFKK